MSAAIVGLGFQTPPASSASGIARCQLANSASSWHPSRPLPSAPSRREAIFLLALILMASRSRGCAPCGPDVCEPGGCQAAHADAPGLL